MSRAPRSTKRSPAKTGNATAVSMEAVSGAARTRARPVGTVLPADWRHRCNSRVWMMLAKIPERDYAMTQADFERQARSRLSEDWTAEVRAYCRAILVAPRGLFG